jgi:hypothetical protein
MGYKESVNPSNFARKTAEKERDLMRFNSGCPLSGFGRNEKR